MKENEIENKTETFEIKVYWKAVAPMLILVLQDPTKSEEDVEWAKSEIYKMAEWIDWAQPELEKFSKVEEMVENNQHHGGDAGFELARLYDIIKGGDAEDKGDASEENIQSVSYDKIQRIKSSIRELRDTANCPAEKQGDADCTCQNYDLVIDDIESLEPLLKPKFKECLELAVMKTLAKVKDICETNTVVDWSSSDPVEEFQFIYNLLNGVDPEDSDGDDPEEEPEEHLEVQVSVRYEEGYDEYYVDVLNINIKTGEPSPVGEDHQTGDVFKTYSEALDVYYKKGHEYEKAIEEGTHDGKKVRWVNDVAEDLKELAKWKLSTTDKILRRHLGEEDDPFGKRIDFR